MPNYRSLLSAGVLAICSLALAQGPNVPPKVNLKLKQSTAKPAGTVAGEVLVTFAEGMHGYQNPPSEDYMIPVAVKAEGPVTLVKATYPPGTGARVGGASAAVRVYSGAIKIPVLLKAPAKPGVYQAQVVVSYQQCDDNACYAPGKQRAAAKLVVGLPPKPKAKPRKLALSHEPDVFAGHDGWGFRGGITLAQFVPGTSGRQASSASDTSSQSNQAGQPDEDDGFVGNLLRRGFDQGNYGLILFAAILTGLALTLTPCVYPMIPVTLSFFSSQSAGSKGARFGLAAAYMLGIAATYGAVGGIAAALGGQVGQLFTQPWFLFLLAAIMVALALSMFDVYEIRIPNALGKHLRGRSGAAGALIMGLLVGVAAAPCAGALVTAYATKVAEVGSVPLGLLVFGAIGVGIGLPFMALSTVSTGAKTLPKSGGWLKTVKAILGLVVLWIALDYLLKALQFRNGEPRTLAVQAGFFIAAAIYLLVENSGATRLILALKGIAILLFGLLAGDALHARQTAMRDAELSRLTAGAKATPTKVQWIRFTKESFEEAKRSGKPIVIDVTADWCTLCHEIDKAVFQPPRGILAMQSVVPLKIDQSTGVPDEYIDWTNELLGIRGLPHIIFMKPGGQQVRAITGKAGLDTIEELERYLKEIGG